MNFALKMLFFQHLYYHKRQFCRESVPLTDSTVSLHYYIRFNLIFSKAKSQIVYFLSSMREIRLPFSGTAEKKRVKTGSSFTVSCGVPEPVMRAGFLPSSELDDMFNL